MKNCNTTEPQSTQRSPIIGCLTALGLALTFAVPQAAHAQNVTPPSVPAGLEVPPPNVAFLVGHAIGTQNYECQPSPLTRARRLDAIYATGDVVRRPGRSTHHPLLQPHP